MSFQAPYGKVNEVDQAKLDARRKTRRRIAVVSVSSVVLVCVVVAAVLVTARHGTSSGGNPPEGTDSISPSVKAVCDVTLYKDTCYTSLGSRANSSHLSPEELLNLSVKLAAEELLETAKHFSKKGDAYRNVTDKMTLAAIESCEELLDLAIDRLNESMSSVEGGGGRGGRDSLAEVAEDLETWLSSAGTYQETCLDAIREADGDGQHSVLVQDYMKNSTEMTSNALAIVSWLSKITKSLKLRRLMSSTEEHMNDPMASPSWLSNRDRELIESSDLRKKAHIVVAKDGTGKYKNISRALKDVPEKSKKRTIIYVKKGVYKENVKVEKKHWNVLMVGDGGRSTVVTGRLNFVDGTGTFKTATFAVFGKGFIARDMGFRNTAGALKHQAVALMSSADHTIFYRCHIDAFQDTLYAHAQRQFYRDCTILGTVDFIFGNSAAVLQNCRIRPRRPMTGQKNTITAQGRSDPNQNTGLSIHNSTIAPFGNLSDVQTFLGRPWKNYSTTVFMKSFVDGFVDPKGWLPWTGDSAPDTIFYGEFANFGPGASTRRRVKWKGLKFIGTKEASLFTVKSFIGGDRWLPKTGVEFKAGL